MENNLGNKSTKELEGSLKGLKIISTALIIVIGLLLSITIYGMLFKDNNSTFVSLFAVGVSCAAILPLQFSSMNKIKKELKSRE
jgi:hypothetical protein